MGADHSGPDVATTMRIETDSPLRSGPGLSVAVLTHGPKDPGLFMCPFLHARLRRGYFGIVAVVVGVVMVWYGDEILASGVHGGVAWS